MTASETQRNWNEIYNNKHYKKRKNSFIPILVILSICAAAIYYYKDDINDFIKDISKENNETIRTSDKTTESAVNSNEETATFSDFTIDKEQIIEKYGIPSNQNGTVMAQSLNRISEIFSNLDNKTIDELYNYVAEIDNIDLSSHYNTFKSMMRLKLNYWIEYKRDKNPDSITKYNSINYSEELSKAFDAAGVRYEIEKNRIIYWYTAD